MSQVPDQAAISTPTNDKLTLAISPSLISRFELGDVLIFFYFLVFVKQCFWTLQNNSAAWVLATLFTIPLWMAYVCCDQSPRVRYGRSFWIVVALPLLLTYLLRATFPDRSFDVLNYHLLHSERTLTGPLFQGNDFFHSTPFNPAADTLTGLSRMLLGYRLGTLINLLALLWTAQIVDRLLRKVVAQPWHRAGAVLLVLFIENILFEITTYLVDILMLPILLQATLLTIDPGDSKNHRTNFIRVALLLGVGAALKFTTLGVAVPLLVICAFREFFGANGDSLKQKLTTLVAMVLIFLAPLVPFSVYIYRLTGNPIFPVANRLFQSPYWPTSGGWDNRWGPQTVLETIGWPILSWFYPERYTELGVYAGRLSLGFAVAVVASILMWREKKVRELSLILIATAYLWCLTALGYSRYGMYQDVLAGVLLVVVIATLVQKSTVHKMVGVILLVCLAAQAVLAGRFTLQKEWGERNTIIRVPDQYFSEARNLFVDRNLLSYQTDEARAQLSKAKVWLETSPKTTGLEALLNPYAPIIAVRQGEFFFNRHGWKSFIEKVEASPQHGMYTLTFASELQTAKDLIHQRGLETGEITHLDFQFFSVRDRMSIMLIEINLPKDEKAREEFRTAWLKAAFSDADYREEITALSTKSVMRIGEQVEMKFKVKNLGNATWPAEGFENFRYQVNLGAHWIGNGTSVDASHTRMNSDLLPGEETEVTVKLTAPNKPGDYILEIDMVHEGLSWFKDRGARPLVISVKVEP